MNEYDLDSIESDGDISLKKKCKKIKIKYFDSFFINERI